MEDQTKHPSVPVMVVKTLLLIVAFIATMVLACAIATVMTR
jgi:hypothetical protein